MKCFRILFLAFSLFFVFCLDLQAGARSNKKSGIYLDYQLGHKNLGANFGYNAIEWLRLHGGATVATDGSGFGVNGGVRFMIAEWDLTPFLDISSGKGYGALWPSVGGEWTASSGLNLGASLTLYGAGFFLGYYF